MNWFPPEIQEIIWSYDPTFREVFSRVIHQIDKTLSFHRELVFKKQYQKFFGIGIYGICHKKKVEYSKSNNGIYYRVASLQNEFDYHCNSFLFKVHKLLLLMEARDVWCYEYKDWRRFRNRNIGIQEIIYDEDSEEEYNDNDDDDDEQDESSD